MRDGYFGDRSRRDPERTALVKQWARTAFQVEDGFSVFVTELRCHEPGCPPWETVVALVGEEGPPRQYKLHKPMADVTFDDLALMAVSAKNEQSARAEENPT